MVWMLRLEERAPVFCSARLSSRLPLESKIDRHEEHFDGDGLVGFVSTQYLPCRVGGVVCRANERLHRLSPVLVGGNVDNRLRCNDPKPTNAATNTHARP
jgi:hypothetical protein